MLSNFDLKLRQTLYVRLPFIVALRAQKNKKKGLPRPLSLSFRMFRRSETAAAGPIQENFKPDPLGSRGDLNKSDRMAYGTDQK